MSPRARLVLFTVVAPAFAVLFFLAARGLPSFGSDFHPYGDRAVAMATGWHLLYVAGRYAALRRAAPPTVLELIESLSAAAFAAVGLVGLAVGGAFLANVLPTGSLGELLSGETVPVLNAAVGVEVATAVVLLLAAFLEQAVVVRHADHQDQR